MSATTWKTPASTAPLLGDGLATSLASLFGAPANTTYGENTGVLALSKVYDPRVIRIAASLAILLSFSPKFAALVSAMPTATMGGVSMVLYGMISAVGVRNVVENQVDFTNSRNVIVAAIIMVLAIGVNYSGAVTFTVGTATISLSGLAVAAITGIALNAIPPRQGTTSSATTRRVTPPSTSRSDARDPARSSRRPPGRRELLSPVPYCSERKMKVLWKKFKTIKSTPKSFAPTRKIG